VVFLPIVSVCHKPDSPSLVIVYDDHRDRYLNLVLDELDKKLFKLYQAEWDLFESDPKNNETPIVPVEDHLTPVPRFCRKTARQDARERMG